MKTKVVNVGRSKGHHGNNQREYFMRKKIVSVVCFYCGKEFKTSLFQKINNKHNFCSTKCKKEYKPGCISLVKTKCCVCNKEFSVRKDVVYRGFGKHCSRKCMGETYKKERSGSGSTNWKGGITDEIKLIKNSRKYKDWIISVFQRDGFRCAKCGKVKPKLNAHHLIRFKKLIDNLKEIFGKDNIYESAMKYSPLWEINNGETLCVDCHKKEHKQHGYH